MTMHIPPSAHPRDFADVADEQLRTKGYYFKPAERFVGFGRASPQLDLFKKEYRLGWWTLGVCRACIVTEVNNLRSEVAQHKAVIARAKENVAAAIGIVEKRGGQ
jgi:hypothetical protein